MGVVSGSTSPGDGEQEKRQTAWRRRAKPDNEIPVTVAGSLLLGRTDEIAVALVDIRVYRNGVEFTVSARSRGRAARSRVLHMGIGGHPHPLEAQLGGPFLLGFEFSDGRSVSSLRQWPSKTSRSADDERGPWLTSGGGGGSTRSADHDFFLAPLPPGDTLALIAAWPDLGIEESRHLLDARAIRDAAGRVIELWPAEPDDAGDSEPPPPPQLPPGSWFHRT